MGKRVDLENARPRPPIVEEQDAGPLVSPADPLVLQLIQSWSQ
jgi:hypothetical protein